MLLIFMLGYEKNSGHFSSTKSGTDLNEDLRVWRSARVVM